MIKPKIMYNYDKKKENQRIMYNYDKKKDNVQL